MRVVAGGRVIDRVETPQSPVGELGRQIDGQDTFWVMASRPLVVVVSTATPRFRVAIAFTPRPA